MSTSALDKIPDVAQSSTSSLDKVPNTSELDRLPNSDEPSELDKIGSAYSSMGDRYKNIYNLVRFGYLRQVNDPIAKQTQDEYTAARASAVPWTDAAKAAFGNIWDGIKSTIKSIPEEALKIDYILANPFSHEATETVGGELKSQFESLATLPAGALTLLTKPIDALTGVDMGTMSALNAGERGKAMQEVGGTVAAAVAGGLTANLAKNAMAADLVGGIGGKDVLTGLAGSTDEELARIAASRQLEAVGQPALGPLGRKVLTHAASGAVGAEAYTIAAGDSNTKINNIIGNAITFGSLAGMSSLFGKMTPEDFAKDPVIGIQNTASMIQNLRGLKATGTDSFYNVMAKQDAFSDPDDLANAIVKGKVEVRPDRPSLLSGVTNIDALNSTIDLGYGNSLEPESRLQVGLQFRTRLNGDGSHDVLVLPRSQLTGQVYVEIDHGLSQSDIESWEKDGVIPNQRVGYLGKSYTAIGRDVGDSYKLAGDDGSVIHAPLKDLTQLSDLDVITPSKAYDAVYNKFVADYIGKFARDPNVNFSQEVKSLGAMMGMSDAQTHSMEQEFSQRLGQSLQKTIDPEDLEFINKAKASVDKSINNYTETAKTIDQIDRRSLTEKVVGLARSAGMYMTPTESKIELRDAQTGRLIHSVDKMTEAQDFITRTGNYGMSDLDDIGSLPKTPYIAKIDMDLAGKPIQSVPVKPLGAANYINQWFNSRATRIAPPSYNFDGMDNINAKEGISSAFFKGFDATQVAWKETQAKIVNWLQRMDVADKLMKQLPDEDLAKMRMAITTLSPSEIKNGQFLHRSLTPEEQAEGEEWARNQVDFHQIDAARNLFDKGKLSNPQALKDLNLSDYEQQVLRRHIELESASNGGDSLLARRVLARATMDNAPTRSEYMEREGMSPVSQHIVSIFSRLYDEAGATFGITEARRLRNYMSEIGYSPSFNFNGTPDDPSTQFFAEFTRSDIDTDTRVDPRQDFANYIRQGFRSKVLNSAIRDANSDVKFSDVGRRAEAGDRTAAAQMARWNRYVNDLRGYKPEMDANIDKFVEGLNQYLPKSLQLPSDLVGRFVGLETGIVQSNLIGFSVQTALKHFESVASNYIATQGLPAFLRMLRAGVDGKTIENLKNTGELYNNISLHLLTQYDDTIQEPSGPLGRLQDINERIQNTGFAFSGLRQLYDHLAAGSYIEPLNRISGLLNDWYDGKISAEQFARQSKANAIMSPNQLGIFNEMLKNQDFSGASKFYARVVQADNVFTYGAANHPLGWNTYMGRMVGQFGTWATWESALQRKIMSQGTMGQRAAALSKFWGIQTAIHGAAKLTGLNLGKYTVGLGDLVPAGGPLVGLVRNGWTAATSKSPAAQSDAQKQLKQFWPNLIPYYGSVERGFEQYQGNWFESFFGVRPENPNQ